MSEEIHPELKKIVETEGVDIGRIKDQYTAHEIAEDINQQIDKDQLNNDPNWITDRQVKTKVGGEVIYSELRKSDINLSTTSQQKTLGELTVNRDALRLREVLHLAPAIREGDRVAKQYDDLQKAAEAARSIEKD